MIIPPIAFARCAGKVQCLGEMPKKAGRLQSSPTTKNCAGPRCKSSGAGLREGKRAGSAHAALVLPLEAFDGGPDRRERAILMLLFAEGIGVGSKRRVDRLLQQVRKVVIEARPVRPRLRHDIGRNV